MTKNLYYPPFGDRVTAQINTARRVNAARNEVESVAGFASPTECPPDVQARTAMDALGCALASECWLSVAEAVALLQDLEAQLRTD